MWEGGAVKKGRHRRFEEARALKRNQDLELESILDSLSTEEPDLERDEGYSTAYEAWADDYDEEVEPSVEEPDSST